MPERSQRQIPYLSREPKTIQETKVRREMEGEEVIIILP